MFRRFAALVKLRSSATARNADKTLSSSRTIIHSQSTALADCTGYSSVRGARYADSAKEIEDFLADEDALELLRRRRSRSSAAEE